MVEDARHPLRRSDFVSASRRGVRVAHQSRSQATYEQIIDAAIELCVGQDFATVAVSDICDRAQVSPSSFYARFADRDAVFQVLHERYLDAMFAELAAAASSPDLAECSVHELVVEIGESFLRTARSMEPFLSSIRRSEPDHPGLMDRRLTFERRGVDVIVGALTSRAADAGVAVERQRMIVALTSLHATLREMMSPLDPSVVSGVGEDRYLHSLADQFCAYVGVPSPSPSTQPEQPDRGPSDPNQRSEG